MAEAGEEFPRLGLEKVIIAMKGLPCTFKSEIARAMGKWASCQVLYIDDFLGALSLEKGYTSQFLSSGEELVPSAEEAERLHRLAFDALCKSAFRNLNYNDERCVVIKSRLCSTFELDRLLQVSRELMANTFSYGRTTFIIIIIECHIKNEYRLCQRLEYMVDQNKEWYKARSRLDFEKVRDDWLHYSSQPHNNWNLHLCNLIDADEESPTRVIRLVLDPFIDLSLGTYGGIQSLPPTFRDVIHYLLTEHAYGGGQEEFNWIEQVFTSGRYEVLQFGKLRRYLVEQELVRAASGKKSKYLCPTSRTGKCCVFKTYTNGDEDDDNNSDDYNCGVCDKRVISGGYTCHFCFLTLHKSCAEHQGVTFPTAFTSNYSLQHYPTHCETYLPRTYACKSCTEGGAGFSRKCVSCLFQTHLKGRMFPTIIKHDSHQEHCLSLLEVGDDPVKNIACKACDAGLSRGKYGCYVCGLYYCLACVLRPRNVEHSHGGHQHVMKLMYSRDGMEPEEDYWCGVCYGDIDPDYWFYSCPDCPCYEAHSHCSLGTIW